MSTLSCGNFQPGQQISNRYRLVKPLPTPSHPLHWLAEDLYRPKTPNCLVKIALADSEAGNCLQQEALILQTLQHPQIPSLLALDQQTPPHIYLVCDYIEGTLLSERLQSGQSWTEQQVHGFLQASLSILAVCHQQQVIHGNLHPGCLLQRSSDQRWMITGFGANQGTIGYIAPERGQGYPQFSSDLYSLGMIAIQALTGQSPSELQQTAKTGEIRWQQYCQVERSLESLLSRMVAFRPGDRPACAQDALDQLAPSSVQAVGAAAQLFPVKILQKPTQPPTPQKAAPLPATTLTKSTPVATSQPSRILSDLTSQFNRSPIGKGLVVGTGFASVCAGLMCYLPGKSPEAVMGQVVSSGDELLASLEPPVSNPPSRDVSMPSRSPGGHSGDRAAFVPAMPTQSQLTRSQSARSQPSSPIPQPKQQPQQSIPKKPTVPPKPTQAPQNKPIVPTNLAPMVLENQGDILATQETTIAAAAVGDSLPEPLASSAMVDDRPITIAETTRTPDGSDRPASDSSSQAQEAPVVMPVDNYPNMVLADHSYSLPTYSPAIDTQVTGTQVTDANISEPSMKQVATEQPLTEKTMSEEQSIVEIPIAVDLPSPKQSDSLAATPVQPLVLQTSQSEPIASPLQVILSPDEQWMISVSDAYTIKVWNLTAATDIPLNFSTPVAVHAIELAADGSTLLSFAADGSQIAAWDLSSGQQVY